MGDLSLLVLRFLRCEMLSEFRNNYIYMTCLGFSNWGETCRHRVRVFGSVHVSFPGSAIPSLTSDDPPPPLAFQLTNAARLQALIPNKQVPVDERGDWSDGLADARSSRRPPPLPRRPRTRWPSSRRGWPPSSSAWLPTSPGRPSIIWRSASGQGGDGGMQGVVVRCSGTRSGRRCRRSCCSCGGRRRGRAAGTSASTTASTPPTPSARPSSTPPSPPPSPPAPSPASSPSRTPSWPGTRWCGG